MTDITDEERGVLTHTLTGGTGKVYRNHFVADTGHADWDILNALSNKGMMVCHEVDWVIGGHVWSATYKGAEAAGLKLEAPGTPESIVRS